MRRFLSFYGSRTSEYGWLLWLVSVLGVLVLILALATTVEAATAYYSFTGGFVNGTETQSFLFNLNSALRPPAPFTLRTWQYGGGTNAAGDVIAAGGFDPILRLYNDTPTLIAENDDYNPPTVRDSLITWSTSGMPAQLPADNYHLNLVAYNSALGGRAGNWAVDLLADAAKFTLTGVDRNNGTGAAMINSLSLGSDDVRLPARLELGAFDNLSLSDGLVVGSTGAAELIVTTGSISSDSANLGFEPGSFGSVTLKAGGSWASTNGFNLGSQGEGNLRIESGGIATANGVNGRVFVRNGNLTVTGLDSHLIVNESLAVGGDTGETGSVRIEDRAKAYSAGTAYFGDAVGLLYGEGIVEVDGEDSLWSTGSLTVGYSGPGTLAITAGGKVDTAGNAYIGRDIHSHNSSVTLTGAAPDGTPSTWQVSGDLYISGSDHGPSYALESHLTINPGGLVDVTGTTTYWESGGWLELHGGTLRTGRLAKGCGIFDWISGTLDLTNSGLVLDTMTPDTVFGNVLTIGAGKLLVLSGPALSNELIVGDFSIGSLRVEGGGMVKSSLPTAIAKRAGSSGTMLIEGADTVFTSVLPFNVGGDGTNAGGSATVVVEDEGQLVTNSLTTVHLGSTLAVQGIGSNWQAGPVTLGSYGTGTAGITLSQGATVDSGNLDVGLGNVVVNGYLPRLGPRATWSVSGDVSLGSIGSSLTIEQAGRMNVSGAFTLGSSIAPFSPNRVTVQTYGELNVGGTLSVPHAYANVRLLGGQITAHSFIVGSTANFTHTDGTLTVVGGTFDPGTGSGNYTITGNLASDWPKVALTAGASGSLAGPMTVGEDNFGELVVEGGATLRVANLRSSMVTSAPASSKITVQGDGSRLTVFDSATGFHSLMVGVEGPGDLVVRAGGQVEVLQGGASLGCCLGTPGGSGQVLVEGENSRLTAKYVDFRSAGGHSKVTIRDKGVIHATDTGLSNLIFPGTFSSPSSVEVEVANSGSLFQVDGHVLSVDGAAHAVDNTSRLRIHDGGEARLAGNLEVIGDAPGAAYVEVNGGMTGNAGLNVGQAIYVGGTATYSVPGTAKLSVAAGGHVNASTMTVWQPGTVELNAGSISAGGILLAGGTLRGNGSISLGSSLTNAGTVAPGLSAGVLSINGNYVQEAAGTLAIEIGGTAPTQFDRLLVGGSATLHGTLQISLIDPLGGSNVYEPQSSDSFKFLTAAGGLDSAMFDNYLWPTLPGGLRFGALYDYDDSSVSLKVVGVVGDYNLNDVVDSADYVLWREAYRGPNVPPPSLAADGDNDGDVDHNDWNVWRAHFGQVAPPIVPAAGSIVDAVPEPATFLIMLVCLGSWTASFRRCRSLLGSRRSVRLVGTCVATLAFCCLPFEVAQSATIPAAEYHSTLRIQGVDGDRRVESRKEGSVSLDYSYSAPQNQWFVQYVASAQITGGNQLTVDVVGDLQRSNGVIPDPKASAYAWMRYYFAVTKKHPDAPTAPVPLLISARVHGSVTPGSTGNSAGVWSRVSYKHPQAANYELLLALLVGGAGPQSKDLAFDGLRAQPPDAIGAIAIWVEGQAYSGVVDGPSGSFQAIADPYIRIDPTFTVTINGVERLGSEAYGLEFSEGIGSGVPEPATVWLIVIAGALIHLRRNLARCTPDPPLGNRQRDAVVRQCATLSRGVKEEHSS